MAAQSPHLENRACFIIPIGESPCTMCPVLTTTANHYRRVFDCDRYLNAFEHFRRLSAASSAQWRNHFENALCSFKNDSLSVVDLACGFGRFLPLLHDAFGSRFGQIYAVDSSPTMIQGVISRFSDKPWIISVKANAESWCPPAPVHLVFVSEALHLFESPGEVFARLKSFILPGGAIVLRTPSHAQLDSIEWLEDFGLAECDKNRTLDVPQLIAMLDWCGMTHITAHTIDESSQMPAGDYRSMLAGRSFSILSSLSTAEMNEGLNKVDKRITGQTSVLRSCPMTCIIAKVKS